MAWRTGDRVFVELFEAGAPLSGRAAAWGPPVIRERRSGQIAADSFQALSFVGVDGEPAGEATTQRRLEWTFEAPGVYEVGVDLMDGLETGAVSTSVRVEAARREAPRR